MYLKVKLPVLGKILTILWGRKDEGSGRFHCFHHKFLQKAVCSSYWFGSWTCWSIQHSTHTLQQDGLEDQMGCVPRIFLINMVVLHMHHTAGQHHVLSLLIFCWQKLESEALVELTAMTESGCRLQDSFQFFVFMCDSRYHSPPVVDDWLCANKASLDNPVTHQLTGLSPLNAGKPQHCKDLVG